jgi:hypothetical protein
MKIQMIPKKPGGLSRGILASILLAAPAFGTRLAYEGFDYTEADGTSIAGLAGGSGWKEPFPAHTGMVLQPGLAFTGLTTVGKAMRWNPNANTGQGRDWGELNPTTAPANGTYWFSVVVNAGGVSQGNFNWMFSTKSGNGQNGVGFRTSNSSGALNFKPVNPNTDGNAETQAGTGTVGTPSFIVGRLILTGGSDSTFRIWVNPSTNPNIIPGDGDPNSAQTIVSAADTATLRASISGRAFSTGSGDPANFMEYDEIRIGTSFAEVLPPLAGVPEFTLDPLTAIENQTLTFQWSGLPAGANPTLNGSPVTIDGNGSGGTTLPAPAANTTYTLAWSGGGPLIQQFTAIAPFFTLAPASGFFGDTLTLNWRIPAGSTGVTLNPGAVDLNALTSATNGAGTLALPAPETTTPYTISYTYGGNPFTLSQTVTINPPFLDASPPQAIVDTTSLTFTWRISPRWDENTEPLDNLVVLQYGPAASFLDNSYSELDVTAKTNPATGAGTFNPLIPTEGDTNYRIAYKVGGVVQFLTDTVEILPVIIADVSAANNVQPVQVNAAPMNNGVLAYTDRGHVWAAVPSILQGAQFVKLGNSDKETANLEISFTAATNATFFLLLDNRVGDGIGGNNPAAGTDNPPVLGSGVMDWVLSSGFVDSGLDIGLDENPSGPTSIDQSYSVYFRQVAANETYTFFQQADGPARNMYGIAAVAPQITPVAFIANPAVIDQGQGTTLQWTVPVGSTASIDQGIGAVAVDEFGVGSLPVSPSATTTYTLTYDPPGSAPPVSLAPVTVTVNVAPVDTSFAIISVTVAPNGDVSFSWPAPAGVTDPLALTDVVQRSTSLETNSWIELPATGASIVNGIVTFTDTNPPAGGRAFYRIKRVN